MFTALWPLSVPPNMTPAVQSAIEAGSIRYFQQITDEKTRKEISSMIKNIYPDQFFGSMFVTILDYAIYRKKIELCRYFMGDDKWFLPLPKNTVSMLYKLANETGHEIFAEELEQILRNINKENKKKLIKNLLDLNLFNNRGLTCQLDDKYIIPYLDLSELPLYRP